MKICSKCGIEKDEKEFSIGKRSKDGLQSSCKQCAKQYRQSNKEKSKEYQKNYYQENKESLLEYKKQYYSIEENINHKREQSKEYTAKQENKQRKKEYDRKYNQENKERISERNLKYMQQRFKTNINFRLKMSLRSRLHSAIKNNYKAGSAVKDLGCSIDELKIHLEKQFKKGMTWENYGPKGWHIDHVIPLDFFELENSEELQIAVHYTNLQPLWWHENIEKSNKFLDYK